MEGAGTLAQANINPCECFERGWWVWVDLVNGRRDCMKGASQLLAARAQGALQLAGNRGRKQAVANSTVWGSPQGGSIPFQKGGQGRLVAGSS